MHKLVGPSKKRLLIVLGVLVLVGGLAAGYFWYKDKKADEEFKKLKATQAQYAGDVSPSDEYLAALEQIAIRTDDVGEKARTYRALGESYAVINKYNEALTNFKKTQELADEAGFTQEEKDVINGKIVALEYQVQVNSGPPRELEGGFKEPNE